MLHHTYGSYWQRNSFAATEGTAEWYKKQGCWVRADRETACRIGYSEPSGRLVAPVNCRLPFSSASVFFLLSVRSLSYSVTFMVCATFSLSLIPSFFTFLLFLFFFISIYILFVLSFLPLLSTHLQIIYWCPSHDARTFYLVLLSLNGKDVDVRSPSCRYPFQIWNMWPIFTKRDIIVVSRLKQCCII